MDTLGGAHLEQSRSGASCEGMTSRLIPKRRWSAQQSGLLLTVPWVDPKAVLAQCGRPGRCGSEEG